MSKGAQKDLRRAWALIVALVMDTRGDWTRKVAEVTQLPFTRVRALRRLVDGPLTLGELAFSMASDAPAATVAVNDLERRGLVARREHPDDRRAKLVTITPRGRAVVRAVHAVDDPPPDALAALPKEDVATLLRIFEAARAK